MSIEEEWNEPLSVSLGKVLDTSKLPDFGYGIINWTPS